jgi:ring-1,2-phenylacetyl-CoA epoxidase subunit PaaC
MNREHIEALKEYLLSMGDDELILGHRNSEWSGHAPIIEEDIAFANIALDEIGHASVWYSLLAELVSEDPLTYPDQLVFFRNPEDFRNVQLVELPRGDWAFSMLRQYMFDVFEDKHLTALTSSHYSPLAEAAAKIRIEEIYHLRHTSAWIKRLGLGTEESNRRLQMALDQILPLAGQLFSPIEQEEMLVSEKYVPGRDRLEREWHSQVLLFLKECGLEVPDSVSIAESEITRNQHTPNLKVLITEMQSVARLDMQANW